MAESADSLPWIDWLAGLIGIAALVLTLLHIYLTEANQMLVAEVEARDKDIREGVRLSQANLELITLLATMAESAGDPSLRELLEEHGISYTITLPEAGDADAS